MVRSLQASDADLVVTSLTMTMDRGQVLDYLPAIGTETYALFVSTEGKKTKQ